MLSRFHLIPERSVERTDGQTDLLYQYRASVCCWRTIKTVESAEYTWQSQQCNSTNSAAILRMEIKHFAASAYYFLRTIMWRVDLKGLYAKVHETWHYGYSNHLCLTSFFRITIFCRVRAWEQKVYGWVLKILQISSLFGPPCSLRMTRKESK